MIYVKAILAALGAAFILCAYTALVMTAKTPKTIGRGVLVLYFGTPFFWITLAVVSLYAFRITTYR